MGWKRWIALLLLSMLPLQGATAARMLFCGFGAEVSTPTALAVSDHHRHGEPARVDDGTDIEDVGRHAAHAGHADHAAHAAWSDAEGDAAIPNSSSAHESSAEHRCQFCAICLHASTGAPVDRFEWRDAPAANTRPSIVSAGEGLFLTGAPERPPRRAA